MSHRKPLHQLSEGDIQATESGMRWLDLVRTHIFDLRSIDVTWNPASLAANTTVEETVTVAGLKVGDIILSIIKPTYTSGFMVVQGRVSAADTLAIQVTNGTLVASNPASEVYTVIYIKNTKV
jgi:hypothetical protein